MCCLDNILASACETTVHWQAEPAFHPTIEEFSDIEAITYDGLTTENGKTATFAYLGIPKNACPQAPVPAIVLVHGGGGQAYLPWVKMWMDRGYAAIAMSTRGFYPKAINAGSRQSDDPGYRHGMYDSFVKPGYVDSPNENAMADHDLPLPQRWITHALVKVIHAHNLLRSLPQVDNSKIGINGISWGGIITSIVMTHDPRFAFAIPVYGSGYLKEALTYMGPKFQNPANVQYRTEDRFEQVSIPVLWTAWNDDNNFSIQSNSLSYLATAHNNPKTGLVLIHNMGHDHPSGWNPPVIAAFANWVTKNTQPLVTFLTQPTGKNARATLNIPDGIDAVKGTLYWIDAPMTYKTYDKFHNDTPDRTYMEQIWQLAPATVDGNVLSAGLPEQARGYYLEASYEINGQQIYATSVYVAIN